MDERDNCTLQDSVDPMAWLIGPTAVTGSVRHQCTVVIPSIPICIPGVTGGSQQLTVLEVKVSQLGMSGKSTPL